MKVLFVILCVTFSQSGSAVNKRAHTPSTAHHFKDTHFSLTSNNTDWYLSPPPVNINGILSLYRGPVQNGTQATLTIRKHSSEIESLTRFLHKWIREFPLFGFDVLGIKKYSLDNKESYILNVINTSTKKQAEQVISQNNKEFVILTCMDHLKSFQDSLLKCRSIIKSFQWLDRIP